MNRKFILSAQVLFALAVTAIGAQDTGVVTTQSLITQVLQDRSIVFRLYAPPASSVAVFFGNGDNKQSSTPIALTKDTIGLWSVKVGPVPPNLYEYKFEVDGVMVTDPGNRTPKPQRQVSTSLILVPGNPANFLDEQNVPHGAIREETYYSTVLGEIRHLLVYTPPGYDRSSFQPLPVLYLYHGYGDTEYSWTTEGRTAQIMDNLLGQGKCRPMIVVIPGTHALNPDILPIGVEHLRSYWAKNQETADQELFQDIIPFIQERYHLPQQSGSHAIAGLSMGGLQAAASGVLHPDYFSWIGALSPAIWDYAQSDKVKGALASSAAQINRHIKLFQIVTGRSDNVVNPAPQQFADKLEELGIRHELELVDGSHNMDVWRPALVSFVQSIFGKD